MKKFAIIKAKNEKMLSTVDKVPSLIGGMQLKFTV